MRAVIYARYSTELQRDASIEDQVRSCKARIAAEGWTLVCTYTDHAQSGASHLRPGYQQLLADARAGGFGAVVAEALDRLSRDQEHVAGFFKQLTFCGVKIITLAEGEISELHVGLKGTMNALFLKDLAQKTRRGLEGRVREGRSGGGLCFGYDVLRETNARGEPVAGGRSVNAVEAAIVRRIFEAYADGRSPRTIARALNAEGVRGPFGGTWGPSTITGNASRGTGILNNELYVGKLVWNRLRYTKDPITGKRRSRLNPQSAWIVQDVPELRLVSDALWQRKTDRQRALHRATRPDRQDNKQSFWKQRRPRYLFSGLVKCGCCGGNYVVISKNLYGCARARDRGTCTNLLNIRRDVLEASVLEGLKSRLMDPALFRVFADEFYREVNRLRGTEQAKRDTLAEERISVERRLRKLVDAIADGVSGRTLKDELNRLERRQQELEALLSQPAEARPLIHPNLAAIYRQKVTDLHEALQREGSRGEAAEILRDLIEEIILTPDSAELRLDLKGELAGILRLASGSKKPVAVGDGLEQIKLVAGTCNHRQLTLPPVPI